MQLMTRLSLMIYEGIIRGELQSDADEKLLGMPLNLNYLSPAPFKDPKCLSAKNNLKKIIALA